jgi:hypothetical protein
MVKLSWIFPLRTLLCPFGMSSWIHRDFLNSDPTPLYWLSLFLLYIVVSPFCSRRYLALVVCNMFSYLLHPPLSNQPVTALDQIVQKGRMGLWDICFVDRLFCRFHCRPSVLCAHLEGPWTGAGWGGLWNFPDANPSSTPTSLWPVTSCAAFLIWPNANNGNALILYISGFCEYRGYDGSVYIEYVQMCFLTTVS